MAKKTRREIEENLRNKLANKYHEYAEHQQKKYGELWDAYCRARKECDKYQEENEQLKEKVQQYEDWINRLQEFMDMPEDIEEVKVSFPCLLTVQKDIMQPRLPSYKLKKATESRGIQMFTLQDMEDTDEHHYGLNGSPTQVQRIFPPTSDKVQQKLEGTTAEMADQLYRILKKKKFTA